VGKLLDLLAVVHAKYWKSPKLDQESEWLSSLTEGRQFDFFDTDTVKWIDSFVAENSYRKDLITRVGRPPSRLWENVKAVHRYHEKIFPMTLQHGDTGAHNTITCPTAAAGSWTGSSPSAALGPMMCTTSSVPPCPWLIAAHTKKRWWSGIWPGCRPWGSGKSRPLILQCGNLAGP